MSLLVVYLSYLQYVYNIHSFYIWLWIPVFQTSAVQLHKHFDTCGTVSLDQLSVTIKFIRLNPLSQSAVLFGISFVQLNRAIKVFGILVWFFVAVFYFPNMQVNPFTQMLNLGFSKTYWFIRFKHF